MAQKYLDRIQGLHRLKLEHNEEKLRRMGGSYDLDDHGWIPLDLEHEIEPVRDAESGLVTGMEAVTGTFVRYLDAHPTFMHPDSAFAGCWIGNVSYMNEPWRDSERFWENEEMLPVYNITSRGLYAMNHCAPDLRIGLDLGWGGLLHKIEYFESLHNEDYREFYEGEKRLVLAIQRFVKRHAEAAYEKSVQAETEELKAHYAKIAEICDYLVDGAPRSLREALQWIVFWQDVDRMYYNGGAGQELDTLLQPYYERDVKNGLITDDDEVVWYFSSLFFNDPHYSMIGGQDPMTGKDVTSRISFLILEGQHQLNIPNNLALRVSENVNEELFTRAVKYLFEDGTGVCYSCGTGLDKGYMRNGRPANLARMRSKVGCNWTALPGIEYCLQDVTRICLAQPLLLALQDHAEQFLVLRLGKLNAGGKQNPRRLRGGNQNILVAAADHGEKKLVVFVGHFRVLFFQKCLAAQRFLALTQLGRHAVKGFGKFAQIRNGLRIIALGHLLGLPGEVV